jgi:hypothetical protein
MMIVKLTKTFPIRVLEWLLAGIMFSWSIVCWNLRPHEWASPIYAGLAQLGDQNTWAFFAFWIGATRLAALMINGAWRPSPHLRAAGAFLACFMWLQITLGLLAVDVRTWALAVFPWLFLADIYNVFRAANDAGLADDRARAERSQAGASEGADATAH